jgi:hypothetical protein
MTQFLAALPFLLSGLLCITLIDTVGAYASRRLNFNYGYLAILSFAIYTVLGGVISKTHGLIIALLVNMVIGLYDATIGWKLSRRLNANTGLSNDELKELTPSTNLTVMLAVSLLFTYIGYLLV